MKCVSCNSKYCLRCSSSECFQCQSGYSINPLDNHACIADCQNGKYLLDGECVYECSLQSQSFVLDPSSITCIQIQNCPLLSYIPLSQAVGDLQYIFESGDSALAIGRTTIQHIYIYNIKLLFMYVALKKAVPQVSQLYNNNETGFNNYYCYSFIFYINNNNSVTTQAFYVTITTQKAIKFLHSSFYLQTTYTHN
ncbi:hypothetical protein ABPG72_021815 [Tetrahymena utriculariae]